MNNGFDPQAFMDQVYEEASSTSLPPCPEGEFPFMLLDMEKDIEIEEVEAKKGKNIGKTFIFCTVYGTTEDPRAVEGAGRTPVRVRYKFGLDMTPAGKLDMSQGKNIGLGQLREATGTNQPGRPFRFPADLFGKPFVGLVTHRMDEKDESRIYDEIKKVRKP